MGEAKKSGKAIDIPLLTREIEKVLKSNKFQRVEGGVPKETLEVLEPLVKGIVVRAQIKLMGSTSTTYVVKNGKKQETIQACLNLTKNDYKMIDQGWFGTVYQIPRSDSKEKLAVKVERADHEYWGQLDPNSNPIEILEASTKLAEKAGELGIGPKIYRYFTCMHNGIPFFITIMQFIDGMNFLEWQKGKSPDQVSAVVKTVREHITALGNVGILHNDVHAGNVMISKDGKIYIVDYGIATTFEGAVQQQMERLTMSLDSGHPTKTTWRIIEHLIATGTIVMGH